MTSNVTSYQPQSDHSLYNEDYYQWLSITVKQLQNSDYSQVDWKNTIIEQRRQIELLLEDSPSLQTIIADLFNFCYLRAKQDTSYKTGLPIDIFPQDPPFNFEQVLNFNYFYNYD